MQYGLGHLSVVPIRETADPTSVMVSQLLYGDHFKIKEERKRFSRIQTVFDGFEGWVNNDQITKISKTDFNSICNLKSPVYNTDFLSYLTDTQKSLIPVVLGSRLDVSPFISHELDEMPNATIFNKSNLIATAILYLNTPFLAGGKTPFGIDSAGLTQMVYKVNGYTLLRTTEEQSKQGDALSFIEESEPGDLAFFDNYEGVIDHVGIVLQDNYIIHASGKVRIDRLDHTGIFNTDKKMYTHNLRVLKKII